MYLDLIVIEKLNLKNPAHAQCINYHRKNGIIPVSLILSNNTFTNTVYHFSNAVTSSLLILPLLTLFCSILPS